MAAMLYYLNNCYRLEAFLQKKEKLLLYKVFVLSV